MHRLSSRLRHDVSKEFLADTRARRRFDVEGSSCGDSSIAWHDFDAEGITVATTAINDSISPYLLAGEESLIEHGHPTSLLALAFLKLKPLHLPPPPPPKPAKMWVPSRFLPGPGMAKFLLMAGVAVAAGVVIGAAAYFKQDLLKLFGFMGTLLVKAGAFMGSALTALGQCMADHGLACPIHAFFSLIKAAFTLSFKLGAWGVKMIGKFLIKLLKGAVQLGAFTFGAIGKAMKSGWNAIGRLLGKINMGAIMLSIGLGMKKVFVAAGKGIAKGGKMLGKAIVGFGKGLGKMPGLVLGGLTMGLGALKGLGASIKGLFMKGLPKFFGMLLNGPGALLMSTGTVLGGAVSSAASAAGAGLMMIPGMPGLGELAVSAGGVLKDVILGGGKAFINVMGMAGKAIMHIGKAAWNFTGDIMKGLGTIVVKVMAGGLKLAMYIFDVLGKVMLAGIKGLGKGIKGLGKMLGKLAVGGFSLIGKIVTGIPWAIKKLGSGLGKFFSKLGSPSLWLGGALLKANQLGGFVSAKFSKIGFGFVGKAIMGVFKLIGSMGKLVGKAGMFVGKQFGKAMKWMFSKLTKGAVLLVTKLLPKVGDLLMGGMGKLAKLGLSGLKALWSKMQSGALALGKGLHGLKNGLGDALNKLKNTDPRWIATGIILAAYAAWMCKYEGACAGPKKPGWGEPTTHDSSVVRLSEQGWKFKGGSASPKKTSSMYSSPSRASSFLLGMFKKKKQPVGALNIHGNVFSEKQEGKQGLLQLKTYTETDEVEWKDEVGAVQLVEIDRSPSIASLELDGSSSDQWTCGPNGKTRQGLDFGFGALWHPLIKLNVPETSVRVQLHDMETGEVHWDKVYFTDTPGLFDKSARSVGSSGSALDDMLGGRLRGGSSHVSTETPPGGWTNFKRLCPTPGDPTAHQYELNISKYPSNVATMGNDAAMEQNHIGGAHLRAWLVTDPTPPSEKAARKDAKVLKPLTGYGSMAMKAPEKAAMEATETLIAALSPDVNLLSRRQSMPASCGGWPTQRRTQRRRQGEIFFAPPVAGPPSLRTL